ncbi:hypothetical protein Tco_0776750 [Tanacetum coccineum]
MANFATKHSIMTQEMVDSFCNSFYIPTEVYPTAPERGKTISEFLADMGLFDFIKTADPRSERSKFRRTADPRSPNGRSSEGGADQVKLLKSIEHCSMPLMFRASGGSSSAAGAEVSAPVEKRPEDVAVDDVAADEAHLELAEPGEGEEEVVAEPPKKTKRKRLVKQSDPLPAKKLRADHPSLASGTSGKTLTGLEQNRCRQTLYLVGPEQFCYSLSMLYSPL